LQINFVNERWNNKENDTSKIFIASRNLAEAGSGGERREKKER